MDGDAAAAILLTLLGDDEAAAILGALSPDEARRLGTAMLGVANATAADVEHALDLFVGRSRATTGLGLDAGERVRSVFSSALGDVRAGNILAEIVPPTASSLMDKLRWAPPEILTEIFDAEHAQVSALILACLPPETAAAALAPLDDARQSDLLYRAATISEVREDALAELELIVDDYVGATKLKAMKFNSRGDVAKIVTQLPDGVNHRVLKQIKKRDKTLGQQIEDEMLVFDELFALDTKSMGNLLRAIDSQILTLALRGASPQMVDKMLGCMSSRGADTIRDEMADGAAVKRADVEAAQKEVAAIARRLGAEGEITLGGQKGGDYV